MLCQKKSDDKVILLGQIIRKLREFKGTRRFFMPRNKDLSIVNCLGTAMLAYFFTIPVHELFHALTHLAYGDGIRCYSAGAVSEIRMIDYMSLSYFDRIMVAGGSASIINAIIGLILVFIVLKVSVGPLMKIFLIQLMGAQFSEGIGYFLIGGLFGVGDWGTVFQYFPDDPGFVVAMRIVLSVVGSIGIVALFFLLSYTSYYFIKDSENLAERNSVGFKLHLVVLIIGYVVGMTVTALSPSEELNLGLGFLYNMAWIPFFWGFMFTGVMKVLPPKESRFLYTIPEKPNWILFAAGVVLILIDIFVFGPGIFF